MYQMCIKYCIAISFWTNFKRTFFDNKNLSIPDECTPVPIKLM